MATPESPKAFMTNLELRASNPDGTEGEGLSHRSMAGLFLLYSLEVAASGEPRAGVCVVHDQGDRGARYRALADELALSGLAVALPDFRGHGESEGERGHSWGVPEMLRDIDSVSDHLAYMMEPEAPRFFVGQGLGGFYALCYAIEKPDLVTGLVLAGPTLSPKFDVPEKLGGLRGLFKKVGPTTPGRVGWTVDELTSLEAERAAWRADEKVHDVVTVRTAESVAEGMAKYLPRAGEVRCPVLVLHGADDSVSPVESSAMLERDGVERRVLPGVKHDVFHDAGAEKLIGDVRDWVVDVLG